MRHEFVKLARNLAAGTRLALFAPVARLAFRIDVVQLLLLFALSALVDFGADWFAFVLVLDHPLMGEIISQTGLFRERANKEGHHD